MCKAYSVNLGVKYSCTPVYLLASRAGLPLKTVRTRAQNRGVISSQGKETLLRLFQGRGLPKKSSKVTLHVSSLSKDVN